MKFTLKLLLAIAVVIGGFKLVNTILKEPAEGKVEVVKEEPVEVVIEEVVVEEEDVKSEPAEEPVEEVDEPEVVVFKPLPFNGNLKKFLEKNGGKIIDVSVDPRAKAVGGKKGVDVGNAIYFKGKKRKLYVYVKATKELIKLN